MILQRYYDLEKDTLVTVHDVKAAATEALRISEGVRSIKSRVESGIISERQACEEAIALLYGPKPQPAA